ncbi:MAG: hypothetical protein ABSC63_13875 [Candidatus Binataceae bacterium]
MAEYKGELGLKLKALHELGRLLWLERKWDRDAEAPVDVTPGISAEAEDQYRRFLEQSRAAKERQEKALGGERNLGSIVGLRNWRRGLTPYGALAEDLIFSIKAAIHGRNTIAGLADPLPAGLKAHS